MTKYGYVRLSRLSRSEKEIKHSRLLSSKDIELVWGWGSPAGRLRARRRADLISGGAGLGPEKFVLEIGCGTGIFTEMFAGSGAKIIANDISPDLLKKAEKRNLPSDQIQFVEMRFEDLKMDSQFDAVIGSSVLHHLEVEAALSRIFSLLKPGGILSFAEPNMLNPQIFLERVFHFLPVFWYVSADETAFIRWKFSKLLMNVGFENIEITPFDWLHPFTPQHLIPAVDNFGRLLEKIPVIGEISGCLYIKCRRPL